MRLKALILAVFFAMAAAGCARPVKTELSARYPSFSPYRVAVLPVVSDNAAIEDDAARLLRKLVHERLRSMDYSPVALEAIDEQYSRLGAEWFAGRKPPEIAESLGADSVLYIRVREWDRDTFVTYMSLKISADFEVWSAAGPRLWLARYSQSEGDIRLDREALSLALIKAYEPRIQRLVDAVFSTLPQAEPPREAQRTFFQWLP